MTKQDSIVFIIAILTVGFLASLPACVHKVNDTNDNDATLGIQEVKAEEEFGIATKPKVLAQPMLTPAVDIAGVYTQTFERLNRPVYLTSVIVVYTNDYEASAGETFHVDLVRPNEPVYQLLRFAPTNDFNTLSWNVERMHGKLYIRRHDTLVYTLSDTAGAVLRQTGRSD